MIRKTVSFNKEIYSKLQQIRGALLASGKFDELSFTGMVNAVLLSGLTFKPTDEDWEAVGKFLKDESLAIDPGVVEHWYLKLAGLEKAKKSDDTDDHKKAYM